MVNVRRYSRTGLRGSARTLALHEFCCKVVCQTPAGSEQNRGSLLWGCPFSEVHRYPNKKLSLAGPILGLTSLYQIEIRDLLSSWSSTFIVLLVVNTVPVRESSKGRRAVTGHRFKGKHRRQLDV